MIYPASASPVIRYNTFEFAYGRGVSFISSPLSTSIHDNNFNNVPYPTRRWQRQLGGRHHPE